MGVRRLKKFIAESDFSNHVVAQVDLRQLGEQWREMGGQTVLAVDGINLLFRLTEGPDKVCGGELKTIAQRTERLLDAFQEISVQLVFFMDGPVGLHNLQRYMERHRETIAKVEEAFRNVEMFPISEQTPPVLACMTGITQIVKSRCKMVQCEEDPDKEIARYVVKNKCLGVLSGDTDFLIYDGLPHVICSESLNIENMTALEYRTSVLAEYLGLRPQAMPIFATLMGNDAINYQDSREYFRRKFWRVPFHRMVMALSRIARDIEARSQGNVDWAALYLAEEIFGRRDYKPVTLKSLLDYDCHSEEVIETASVTATHKEWDQIVNRCLQCYREMKIPSQVMSVVKNQLYTQVSRFEDTRSPCAEVLRMQRRRFYSVLLYEKTLPPGGTEVVEEACGAGPGSLNRTATVRTVHVDVEHPGLLRLWDGGESYDECRWKLAWWVICGSQSDVSYEVFSSLRNLPGDFIQVLTVLIFMAVVVRKIDERELKAFLVMAAVVPEMDCEQLTRFPVQFTTKRAVSMATLYQQTYKSIKTTFKACGVQIKSKQVNCYSGLLLHHLFKQNEPTELLNNLTEKARDNYAQLRSVLDQFLSF